MKNKIKFKRYLRKSLFLTIILIIIMLIMNIYQYHTYRDNYNHKILSILTIIKEKYPDITDDELVVILESNNYDSDILKQYNLNYQEHSLIKENESKFKVFISLNLLFLVISIMLIIYLNLDYDYKKDKELKEITRYIEEINKKNYSLHINDISEDELSILKNEIYKTTIMLKESAENSLKDKKDLKVSLENISHQLKTPLTSILVMLDNLIDDPDMDKDTREDFIRDIKREVMNINFLVQAILKLSRFDSNTVTYVKDKYYVHELVDETLKNVSSLADLRNIIIDVKGHPDISLNCDIKWQVEALTNIVKNAIDHSIDNNKIIISYDKNNVYVHLKIEDFGKGIPKEDIPHIFERFYKGKNATKDSIGIGLALAKTIIEEDNGVISVTSNKHGTTFDIKYYTI